MGLPLNSTGSERYPPHISRLTATENQHPHKTPTRMAGGFVLAVPPSRAERRGPIRSRASAECPAIRGSLFVLASPAAPSGRLRRSGPLPEDGQRSFGPLGVPPFFLFDFEEQKKPRSGPSPPSAPCG